MALTECTRHGARHGVSTVSLFGVGGFSSGGLVLVSSRRCTWGHLSRLSCLWCRPLPSGAGPRCVTRGTFKKEEFGRGETFVETQEVRYGACLDVWYLESTPALSQSIFPVHRCQRIAPMSCVLLSSPFFLTLHNCPGPAPSHISTILAKHPICLTSYMATFLHISRTAVSPCSFHVKARGHRLGDQRKRGHGRRQRGMPGDGRAARAVPGHLRPTA